MNLPHRQLRGTLLVLAIAFPSVSWCDDTAGPTPPNPHIESLRRSKAAHLKTIETLKKSGSPNSFAPDNLIVRRYDQAIASAEKIIASGGSYGREEVMAAHKVISAESEKIRTRFLETTTQQAQAAMRESTEKYKRAIAESEKTFDTKMADANAKFQRTRAQANVTMRLRMNAGKLGVMIWNLPTKPALHERRTVSVRIELMQQNRIVWTNKFVRLDRRRENTPVRLPNVLFDKVRVETLGWTGSGSGLAEIEVYAGNENIALGKPCEVSSIETLPMHLDDRDALTDGVLSPTKIGNGYWIPEEETKASVTIDLLGAPNKEVIEAAKRRAALAPAR